MKKELSPGNKFQNDFVKSLSPLLSCTRLNDSREGLSQEKNPGDYIVFNAQTEYYIELKTSLGKSMSIGEPKGYKIRTGQLNLVVKSAEFPNCEGYYILNFRESLKTYRVLARSIKYMHDHQKKKSITIDDCEEFGFLVPEKDCVYDLSFLNPLVGFSVLS